MSSVVWLNGELVDDQQAHINVFDHGLTVADGIFETLKVSNGQVFALDRHLDRLQHSADVLGFGALDRVHIAKGCAEVVAANSDIEHGRLRITVTSGMGPLGSDRLAGPATLVIAISPMTPWPIETSVVVVPWVRNERSAIAGAKSTSYAENVVALEAAHSAGFSEAVFTDTRGNVSEGTGTNIFIVSNSKILTPPRDTGLLEGITRNLVIEWAQQASIDIHERHFAVADLMEADEIFITSSTRDVHPVTQVGIMTPDRNVVSRANKPIGSLTQMVQTMFKANSTKEMNP